MSKGSRHYTVAVFGAIMAIMTSMNSAMIAPSRLAFILSRDGLAPGWIGAIHPRAGTPVLRLTLTLVASALFLAGRQILLALNVTILALVILYFLRGVARMIRSHLINGLVACGAPEHLRKPT
jgi:APA family basic amino acid/polyamine antiporter